MEVLPIPLPPRGLLGQGFSELGQQPFLSLVVAASFSQEHVHPTHLLFLEADPDPDLEGSLDGVPLVCLQSAPAQATLQSHLCQLIAVGLSAFRHFHAFHLSWHDGLGIDFPAPMTHLFLPPDAGESSAELVDADADAKGNVPEQGPLLGDGSKLAQGDGSKLAQELGAQGASCQTPGAVHLLA